VALTAHAVGLRLGDLPDALVLCELQSAVQTIMLLRRLRAGEIARSDSSIPVLLVGADSDEDAIRYYRAGADIAIPTDSSPLLTAAALNALAARSRDGRRTRVVRIGGVTIDSQARTAHVDGRPLALTRLEFDTLHTLAREPGKAFTRAELTKRVWGHDNPPGLERSRTVDSTIHRVRKKLDAAGAEMAPHNVRGIGWRLAT
jgi:DNA-binding response OmpR family regulator